jgi:hypothetical protein
MAEDTSSAVALPPIRRQILKHGAGLRIGNQLFGNAVFRKMEQKNAG